MSTREIPVWNVGPEPLQAAYSGLLETGLGFFDRFPGHVFKVADRKEISKDGLVTYTGGDPSIILVHEAPFFDVQLSQEPESGLRINLTTTEPAKRPTPCKFERRLLSIILSPGIATTALRATVHEVDDVLCTDKDGNVNPHIRYVVNESDRQLAPADIKLVVKTIDERLQPWLPPDTDGEDYIQVPAKDPRTGMLGRIAGRFQHDR